MQHQVMSGDGHRAIHAERYTISDCLLTLGYRNLAVHAQRSASLLELDEYLKVLRSSNDTDVLDRLYFAGLIYGIRG